MEIRAYCELWGVTGNLFSPGHVQIAQAPHRQDPMSAGELNYCYVLQKLAGAGTQLSLEDQKYTSTVQVIAFTYSCALQGMMVSSEQSISHQLQPQQQWDG